MATRPGPLRDIPLQHARLQPHADGLFHPPSKRPCSPSTRAICSPPKRRLTTEQALGGALYASTPRLAQVHSILHGPNSPARKLDFGVVASSNRDNADENMETESEPAHRTRSVTKRLEAGITLSPLLPSSYTSSQPSSSTRKSSSRLGTTLEGLPIDHQMMDHSIRPIAPPPWTTQSATMRREVRPPDRRSMHYPGFDVYQDPFNYVLGDTNALTPPPSPMDITSDDEAEKENARPVRSTNGMAGAAAWVKAGLLTPREIAMRSPTTPRAKTSALPEVDDDTVAGEPDDAITLDTPRAQRRMCDIGNHLGRTSLGGRGRMMLTSTSFLMLSPGKEKGELQVVGSSDDESDGMEVEEDGEWNGDREGERENENESERGRAKGRAYPRI